MKHINIGTLGIPSNKDIIRINNTKVKPKSMVKLLNMVILFLHIVILESRKSHHFHHTNILGFFILVQDPCWSRVPQLQKNLLF